MTAGGIVAAGVLSAMLAIAGRAWWRRRAAAEEAVISLRQTLDFRLRAQVLDLTDDNMSVPWRGTVLRRSWWGRAPARCALLATLLVALAVPAAAPAATGGKITGRVTDGNGQTPLFALAAYAYRADTGEQVASAWVYPLLGYQLSVPADGDYKVWFADTRATSYNVAEFYDDKPTLAQADPSTVSGGATVSRVDAALATGGRISGRVRTTSGIAINGATVAAYDAGTGAFPDLRDDQLHRYVHPAGDRGRHLQALRRRAVGRRLHQRVLRQRGHPRGR